MNRSYIWISAAAFWLTAGCVEILHSQQAAPADAHRAEQAFLERIPRADLGNGYFRNPVLVGPGADNTILRVGKDYYMLAGGGWPDQLIWHSRDMVNWAPITRTLRKFNGHAWATDLSYYQGRYFIYTTQVDPDRGQHRSTEPFAAESARWAAERPRRQGLGQHRDVGRQSRRTMERSVHLGVYGLFDPGHVVDQQGNRYLYFNKGMMIRLAADGLSTVGDLKKVYDGWDYPQDWVLECKCLEAPKIALPRRFLLFSHRAGRHLWADYCAYGDRGAIEVGPRAMGKLSVQSSGADQRPGSKVVAARTWDVDRRHQR